MDRTQQHVSHAQCHQITVGYRFFDDQGNVYSVDNATARPIVDHAGINVSVDESVEITMHMAVDPVIAVIPSTLGTVARVGVALDGVSILADAPEIQVTGHMPALDTCGGHVKTKPGYLDQCGGHVAPAADGRDIYHYHASDTFPNRPPCLVGVQAQGNFFSTVTAGSGAQRAEEDGRNEAPHPKSSGTRGMPPEVEQAALVDPGIALILPQQHKCSA